MKVRRPIMVGVVFVSALSVALILWRLGGTVKTATAIENTDTEHSKRVVASPKPVIAQMPESVAVESGVPIVFYGRLEDQGSQPVAGAEITVTTIVPGAARATSQFVTSSDADGLFALNVGVDQSLKMMPRKTGYALASTNNVATYTSLVNNTGTSHLDPTNPVLIKMWKLQGAEPLLTFGRQYQMAYPNGPLFFDFLTQDIVPSGGDIKISILRPPDSASTDGPQGWRVEIEGVDGGLMQVSPEQWKTTYWAPVDGYQAKLELPLADDVSQSTGDRDQLFFAQTREGGVYTKLAMKISLGDGLVDLDLHGIANTNGSCNWEGDPSTLRAE